jgi:endonuclease III
MKPETVEKIFARFRRADPEPKGELQHINPYTLLVAVVLSAQATDVGVNRATKDLFPIVDTPEKMLALGEAGLKRHIRTIGLFNTKAKNVIALSRILVEQYQGKVPQNREILESLPGVGRKTANVVLGNAFHKDEGIVVDTHVIRLSHRFRITRQTDPEKIEHDLMKLVPKEHWTNWSHWLIWHGRRRCFARKPDCHHCEIFDLCPSGKVFVRTGEALPLSDEKRKPA